MIRPQDWQRVVVVVVEPKILSTGVGGADGEAAVKVIGGKAAISLFTCSSRNLKFISMQYGRTK